MHRHAITAAAGIAGLILGAGGWALLGPEKTHTVTRAAAPASSSKTAAKSSNYASAQAIADKLESAGFVVSMLHKNDAAGDAGMTAYDFTITEKPGVAPGDSGINMFRTHADLAAWAPLSTSMGGVAIVGDTWAVSLTTSTPQGLKLSKQMAPKIATTLGGTVAE